jgi:hypothetical protein
MFCTLNLSSAIFLCALLARHESCGAQPSSQSHSDTFFRSVVSSKYMAAIDKEESLISAYM